MAVERCGNIKTVTYEPGLWSTWRQRGKCAKLDSLGGDLCYAGGQSANPNP